MKKWDHKNYATYHRKEWFLYAGIMALDEIEKLNEKLNGLYKFKNKSFDVIFDKKNDYAQYEKDSKKGKINYSKVFFGKYYCFTDKIYEYWVKEYENTDYLLSADEVIQLLKKYGELVFYPEEVKEFKLF